MEVVWWHGRHDANAPLQAVERLLGQQVSEMEMLARYQRATNYLAAAQIYLQGNVLLREPLKAEHIKERLLGHWGTCPGINMIYAHLNRLIVRNDIDMFLITGPGHGAPANLANLYLEGSLHEFYPALTGDEAGLAWHRRSVAEIVSFFRIRAACAPRVLCVRRFIGAITTGRRARAFFARRRTSCVLVLFMTASMRC